METTSETTHILVSGRQDALVALASEYEIVDDATPAVAVRLARSEHVKRLVEVLIVDHERQRVLLEGQKCEQKKYKNMTN